MDVEEKLDHTSNEIMPPAEKQLGYLRVHYLTEEQETVGILSIEKQAALKRGFSRSLRNE